MNPYEILNVSEDADFETLKARYEQLKAVYGEQRFLPGEEGTKGAEKLTELEEAWREITDKLKQKEEAEKYGTGYSAVEKLVMEKKYDEAQSVLDAINERDGEWHYYQALVFYKREWMGDSLTQLKEAVRLAPDNAKYKEALNKMTMVMGNANVPPENLGVPQGARPASGSCLSDCCTMLCCMECLSLPCRCCGA